MGPGGVSGCFQMAPPISLRIVLFQNYRQILQWPPSGSVSNLPSKFVSAMPHGVSIGFFSIRTRGRLWGNPVGVSGGLDVGRLQF